MDFIPSSTQVYSGLRKIEDISNHCKFTCHIQGQMDLTQSFHNITQFGIKN